jgi:hypothetical protein
MTARTDNSKCEKQEQAKAKYRDSGFARMTNKKQERNAGILRYAQNDNHLGGALSARLKPCPSVFASACG